MNNILIIEDNESDFKRISKEFGSWNISPKNHGDIDYSNSDNVLSYIKEAMEREEEKITSIILDISLQGPNDKDGLKILKNIRNSDGIKFKTIPIFCYSGYADIEDIRSEAFKNGATNVFYKGDVEESDEMSFLTHSLTALSFIYADINMITQERDEVIKGIEGVNDKLRNIEASNTAMITAIMNLSSHSDILEMTEINDTNRSVIANALGGEEVLNELLHKKLLKEDKEKVAQQINDVASILVGIPGLSALSPILKAINLILKNSE